MLLLNTNALLSEDPDRAAELEAALARFLTQAKSGDFTSAVVDPEERERNSFFFRRVTGFGGTPGLRAPSVLKAYTLDGNDYFVTVAFGGEWGGVPFLDMIVELKATPVGESFRFQCPFEDRTKDFHETVLDDVRFRYSGGFDEERARQFMTTRAELGRLSGLGLAPVEYFVFQSLDEMLKSYGLVFDRNRCNFLGNDLGTFDDGHARYITGMGDECYMYGYASRFLRSPDHDPAELYRTMAVGFKILYGGYWLNGTPMGQLIAELRETVRGAPELNLVDIFKQGRNGQTKGHAPSLVIAALICERAIEQAGFAGLLRLVYSGPRGERFFAELDEVLGIDETGFRAAVVAMLEGT
ncbi:MAG: hypothetical protein NXI31_20635 [bacterium]|nr:hypothetical protein [bacterium]